MLKKSFIYAFSTILILSSTGCGSKKDNNEFVEITDIVSRPAGYSEKAIPDDVKTMEDFYYYNISEYLNNKNYENEVNFNEDKLEIALNDSLSERDLLELKAFLKNLGSIYLPNQPVSVTINHGENEELLNFDNAPIETNKNNEYYISIN